VRALADPVVSGRRCARRSEANFSFEKDDRMNKMKVRDPDHWRECAINARDVAKRTPDPEERRLWLQLAEASEAFAKEIEKLQKSNGSTR
jgi:hypothetical protein